MARRAKTVIEGQGSKSREMREAAASGQASVQRQDEFAGRQSAHALDRAGQEGTQVAGIIQRQGQLEEQQATREQRGKIATGQQMQQERGLDLAEREAGYERGPGGDVPPLIAEDRGRREALQAEMGKGTAGEGKPQAEVQGPQPGEASSRSPEDVARLQQQGDQPVEIGGQGAAMPGQEQGGGLRRTSEGEAKQALAEKEGITDRIRAQASMERASAQLMRARAAGDEEKMKVVRDTLMKPLRSSVSQLNRLMAGTGIKSGDWGKLAKEFKDNPDAELQKDIKDMKMTSRVREFLERNIAKQALTYIALTKGEMPQDNVVDFTSPAMSFFMDAQKRVQTAAMQMGPNFQGVRDYTDKIRLLNLGAALEALKMLTNPAAGQLIPSQAESREQQQARQAQEQAQEAQRQEDEQSAIAPARTAGGGQLGAGAAAGLQPPAPTAKAPPGGAGPTGRGGQLPRGRYEGGVK